MAAPTSFEEQGFNRTPAWLRGTWADKLLTVVYGVFDLANALVRDGARQGMVEHCSDDAVDYHADQRQIEKLPGESVAALRLRVLGAWDTWTGSGTKAGLQAILRVYMGNLTGLYVYDVVNDDWTGGAALDGYDDDDADNWSRLHVVIEQPHPWEVPVVGPDLVVGPDTLVGITMTATELSRLRRIFKRFRPAHMIGIGVDVLFDATTGSAHLADHAATADLVRLPLHAPLVGYQQHSMTVGPHLILGQEFK